MSTMLFYRDQAALQQTQADAATLANVRERCQNAANAWTGLADRIQRTDIARAANAPRHDATAPLAEPNENPDSGQSDI